MQMNLFKFNAFSFLNKIDNWNTNIEKKMKRETERRNKIFSFFKNYLSLLIFLKNFFFF